jgi:hypothetical protein
MLASNTEAASLVDTFLEETGSRNQTHLVDLVEFDSGRSILGLTRDQQRDVVLEAIDRQTKNLLEYHRQRWISSPSRLWNHTVALKELISALLRKKLPFQLEHVCRFIDSISTINNYYSWQLSLSGILRTVEGFVEENGLAEPLRARLQALVDLFRPNGQYADMRKATQRLDAMLSGAPDNSGTFELKTDEAWSRSLRNELETSTDSTREAWMRLLLHCSEASQSKPSKRWLQEADSLVTAIGQIHFVSVTSALLNEVGKPGARHVKEIGGREYDVDTTLIHDTHSDLLRGLIWCTGLVQSDEVVLAVGDAAEACYKKIPGIGPRSPKIGNACLYALSSSKSLSAIGQLSRIKVRAKHASIRKQLDKALQVAAEKTGMSMADLEEIGAPTCGLTGVGELRQSLGDSTALVQISEGSKVVASWITPQGKSQKSPPASARTEFATELQALKKAEKEIQKLLPAQRARMEGLFLQERSWSLADFRSRYLDHPLAGVLARRLIWRFADGERASDGIWHDGRIVAVDGEPLHWLFDESRVTNWHPLACGLEQIRAWRSWLEEHGVCQPFKQAHREVYLLTTAERQTETYSNRFAAHILRQHQFSALCQQRGWRYTLQGNWDSHNIPTLHLPLWDLRVEFWVEAIPDQNDGAGSGVFLHISTDQVRFYHTDETQPMRLADVPPLVFSEIMRDVDLFVGVASVGNDPNWSDGGPGGQYRDYWQSYSFGELSATAQTRRALLERLIPRLKIADRCNLADRFLVVRGSKRTYKIHLGSGNILMEPNDQYLCIVPKQAVTGGERVHLPFEGDGTLSIILSKAFLLADDARITDPSITSQLAR